MKKQWIALLIMLIVYALAASVFVLIGGNNMPLPDGTVQAITIPAWQLALGSAGIILGMYGLLGALGMWLSGLAGFPRIFREGAAPKDLWYVPAGVGAVGGIFLVAVDKIAQRYFDLAAIPHPAFPGSILASLTAGIGEEIIFRLLVMSLWAALLGWLARKLLPGRDLSLPVAWIANLIAALAFGAGHMGSAMVLFGAGSPAELPAALVAEILVLNGVIGLAAGELYRRHGLVAASGVHFWADIVWHVLYGML
jgi:membrane protease YdiL (CAAX protease family)